MKTLLWRVRSFSGDSHHSLSLFERLPLADWDKIAGHKLAEMYSIPAIVLDELIEVTGTGFEPVSVGGRIHPSGCSFFQQQSQACFRNGRSEV